MTTPPLPTVVVLGHFPELARHLDSSRYEFLLIIESDADHPSVASMYREVLIVTGMHRAAIAEAVLEDAHSPVVAVLAGRERYTVAAAALGSRLGCQPHDVSVMENFENKAQFRRAVNDAGLSPYPHVTPTSVTDLKDLLASSAHGVVVKPARGNASKGVKLITLNANLDVLALALATATATAGDNGLVAEAYVPGRAYSIEIIRSHGQTWFTNLTEKKLTGSLPLAANASPFVPLEHRLPAEISGAEQADLVDRTNRFLDHVGADSGLFHAEWQVPDVGEPHFVECAARFPGGELGAAIHAAYEVNLATLWIEALTRPRSAPRTSPAASMRPTAHQPVSPRRMSACLAFVADHEGELLALDGLEDVRAMDGVAVVTPRCHVGDQVTPAADGSERLLMAVVTGHTVAELDDRIATIRAGIDIRISSAAPVGTR